MWVPSTTHLSGHLERIAVREVCVRRSHGQDNGIRIVDVLHAHAADLLLDVGRLISSRHLPNRVGLLTHKALTKQQQTYLEHCGTLVTPSRCV